MTLQIRQYYSGYGCGYYNNCNSTWGNWGRWVLLGCLIFAAILLFFLFSCLTARRRRRQGTNPYYGTGWALGRTPAGHAPATYSGGAQPYYANQQTQQQPYYNNSNNPPPAYSPPPNNYAGRDVELQQPANAYHGDGGVGHYAPPKDPPPGR